MRLTITGANGFIGSHFIKENASRYEIQTFSFLRDDFKNLKLDNTNVVLHLGALVHQMSGADESQYKRVNVDQTLMLAHKAKECGVKHFIFMSSVKVYGEESEFCYDEESLTTPADPYGKSKLEAEVELKKLEDEQFIISIIRTPVVYGEGVKANILSLVNLVKKVPLLPFKDIQNRRSFVYVGNLCALIDKIIQKRASGIFLASDEKSLSTSEFIELISYAQGKKVVLFHLPFFESVLRVLKPSIYQRLYENLCVDSRKTNEILEFTPVFSTFDGIKKMVA